MKNILIAICLVLVVLVSSAVNAQDNPATVIQNVDGNAPIKDNDLAQAREDAIADALRMAIMNSSASLLTKNHPDADVAELQKTIMQQSDKYVINYKILTEKKESPTYKVNVNVTVAVGALQDDLTKLGHVQNKPGEKATVILALHIKGLNHYNQYKSLKDFLLSRKSLVKNISAYNFAWRQADMKIDLQESVSAQNLADELTKTGRYSVDTLQQENNNMEITVLK